MSINLTFTTDTMDVCIKNYEPYSFEYNGWIVSDHYVYNEINPRGSYYSIIVSSQHSIFNEEDLNEDRYLGQGVLDLITSLIPICGLPPLNNPKYNDFLDSTFIFDYRSEPQGWKTNYHEIEHLFEAEKQSKMKVSIKYIGVFKYSIIEKSPLKELEFMMNNYMSIQDDTKFLVFLNNSILMSDDINVFMLIGKALEIINAMYPYDNRHGKDDKRIIELFPELIDVFQGITIKELMSFSNNRKETRHFVNKRSKQPHDSLSSEERIQLFKCTTSLIINVVREKFGLSRSKIVFMS